MKNKNLEYDIKCRKCGKIEKMHFGTKERTTHKDFRLWASEYSTFPFSQKCECSEDMNTFHDLVAISD